MIPFSYPTSAEQWQNVALGLTVIAFTLAFFIAATNAALTWKVNRVKKEESRRKDEQLARDLKAKDLQIASADKQAAQANAAAGSANEKAALANERAEKLESDNLQLRRDLEAATAESRTKQADLAKEQIKLAEEQRKTAEAQREAAIAQLALKKHLEEVAERQKPRRLTLEQRAKLHELLKGGAKGTFELWYIAGDPESQNFADELIAVLKDAGWTLEKIDSMLSADPLSGHLIIVQNKQNPRAATLQRALQEIGFPVAGQLEQTRPEGYMRLCVGTKP